MAFGIGKAFKKGWKKAFGWADDDITKSIAGGIVVGALTGGLGGLAYGALASGLTAAGSAGMGAALGAGMGGLQGWNSGYQMQQQEKIAKAQIASAEKIAAMQNQPVVEAAATPTSSMQEALFAEQNAGTAKKRAFSFARTQRMGSVARKNRLG